MSQTGYKPNFIMNDVYDIINIINMKTTLINNTALNYTVDNFKVKSYSISVCIAFYIAYYQVPNTYNAIL